MAKELGIEVVERRISLAEFHAADEVFTTGTMGELTPVREIDGRPIGWGAYTCTPVKDHSRTAFEVVTVSFAKCQINVNLCCVDVWNTDPNG